jgi:ATP-dependent DNA helicase RecQ
MKVLIIGKTRRGSGACVGGITEDGRCVRLVAADAAINARAGLEYGIGEVWEIDWAPDTDIIPPHVENIIVHRAHHIRHSHRLEETIRRFMPPVAGGPEGLFEGLAQATERELYIAQRTDCRVTARLFGCQTNRSNSTAKTNGFTTATQLTMVDVLWRLSDFRIRFPKSQPALCFAFLWLTGGIPRIDPTRNSVVLCSCRVGLGRRSRAARASPRVADLQPPAPNPPWRSPTCSRAYQVRQAFGFSRNSPVQRDVISRVLHAGIPSQSCRRAAAILCYQLPAILADGLTVVVLTLVTLMQDQVRQLREVDIPASV